MAKSIEGILIAVAAAGIFGYLWIQDFSAARKGTPAKGALPGATPCPTGFIVAGAIGAILLTLGETAGEYALGISGEQKNITALFLAAMLAAAIVEEIIFRGYLVITGKGRAVLIAGVVGASLLFALAHDFLWQFSMPENAPWYEFYRGFSANFSVKGCFSFGVVFAISLYFYALRFHPKNAARSLLPCFAGHAARNLAVFAIKLFQGHVAGWY